MLVRSFTIILGAISALLASGATKSILHAEVVLPVSSTFHSDLDGWRLLQGLQSALTWQGTGGNPSGFARFQDVDSYTGTVIAPSKFLGDWSALDGTGSLSWNQILIDEGSNPKDTLPYEALISGPGGVARYVGIVASDASWSVISVPISQSAWTVDSGGDWEAIISNVTSLQLRIELINGSADIEGIDNVILSGVPTPVGALQPMVCSHFWVDLEGWILVCGDTSGLVYGADGGNSGGYARFEDPDGLGSFISAPSYYLGDWSELSESGQLSWDQKIFNIGEDVDMFLPYEARITGPGGAASFTAPAPIGATPWCSFEAPLSPTTWILETGNWAELLSNVTEMLIRIEVVDNHGVPGDIEGIDNICLWKSAPASFDYEPKASAYSIDCYPNPFNPSLSISFFLGEKAAVDLRIYAVTGKLVRILISEPLESGHHSAIWDAKASNGKRVSSGVYFACLNIGGKMLVKKIILAM